MLDDVRRGGGDLLQVVRRDARREADGNSKRTIEQAERQPGGKQHRLIELAVVVLLKIDGALPYFAQQEFGVTRELGLGVAIRRRRVPVPGTEIPLAVDQRI